MPKRKRGPMPARIRQVRQRRSTFKKRRNVRTGGFLGIETKFFDTETVDDAFSTTWAPMEPATTNLSAIAQGDGESNRDGKQYAIKSIHLKGFVASTSQESSTTPVPDRTVRICLVLDTQTNAAQLVATSVMDGGQTEDIFSFRNLQFTKRFRVLFDRTINIPTARASTNEGAINLFAAPEVRVLFKINKTFNPPIMVNMSGTTADIANVTDNSLHMIGVATGTASTLSYQCRVRFVG